MADFDWINDRVAVGGKIESLADARTIAAAGLTHVLNVRENNVDDEPWVKAAGMKYQHLGSPNDFSPRDEKWISKCVEYAWKVLAEPKARLLVHCKGGEHRSPSIAYAILRSFGVPADDAEEHVTEARDIGEDEIVFRDDIERTLRKLGYSPR